MFGAAFPSVRWFACRWLEHWHHDDLHPRECWFPIEIERPRFPRLQLLRFVLLGRLPHAAGDPAVNGKPGRHARDP